MEGAAKINQIIYDYYVERIGEGEPVIFLPAGGFSGNEGLNLARNLCDKFETHMIDLPGLGKSQGIEGRITPLKLAEWVKEYMDQMQIDKAYLIGHSLGGAILLAFAIHYPDRVYKLILLDEGHKPFPRIPTSEFGPFAYAFPLISVCVQLFRRPVLKRLAPFFIQGNEQGNADYAVHVKEFCDRVAIDENEYIRIAMENPGEF